MPVNPELEHLLDRLRATATPSGLDEVERRVWRQIAERDQQIQSPHVRLSLQAASVVAAFVLGMVFGVQGAKPPPTTPAFLVEDIDLLPTDFSNLLR